MIGKPTKAVCSLTALALLFGQTALCQEPPSLPRLPRQEQTAESPSPEKAAADTTVILQPTTVSTDSVRAAPQLTVSDSTTQSAKPIKKMTAFKMGKIVLDKNGKIFLAATAGLLAVVYLTYKVFQRGVK